MLSGSIDGLSRASAHGWARDTDHPHAAVSILVTVQGRLLARVVANRPRDDLVAAGIGGGNFSFGVTFDPPLPSGRSWLVHFRSEATGAELPGSPRRLPASREFDSQARRSISALLGGFGSEAELDDRIAFLDAERATLLRRRADRARLRPSPGTNHPVRTTRRALVIDHAVPRPDHDGGSAAVVSHMLSLQRLGFEVAFATPSVELASEDAGLSRHRVTRLGEPNFGSVEEVLRRHAGQFDLVYLHRAGIAAAYAALVRQTQPRAHLLYAVADLHHLRQMRQAAFEDRPELAASAERMRGLELWCAGVADSVVTHSTAEADILRAACGSGKVHVAAWSIPLRRPVQPFAARSGLALLGHFAHQPNIAAAYALRDDLLPLLRQALPGIDCLLAGDAVPDALRTLVPGFRSVGHVARLDDLFDTIRLTVAPLPYGAGLKGKVLSSLAAGVPCVCSPIAAEGMNLPPRLSELVAPDTQSAVRMIVRLHEDERYNDRLSERCLAFAGRAFSDQALDRAMAAAVGMAATADQARPKA